MHSSAGSDEGEIIESDSEKATTSLPSVNGTSVDRHSRNPAPAARPAREYDSSRPHPAPASVEEAERGGKRPRDDDFYDDYAKSDTRRFRVHYEGSAHDEPRKPRVSYADLDCDEAPDVHPRYDDRDGRDRLYKRHRTRKSENIEPAPEWEVDEMALIEERRKRREAIKAKYRGQATSLLVQALQLGDQSGPTSPSTSISKLEESETQPTRSVSPKVSPPPQTPREDSPNGFAVGKDEDLADGADGADQDGPSAADYDPTVDMREDRIRDDQRHHGEEVSSAAYDETKTSRQDVLLPASASNGVTEGKKSRDDFDMFAEDDDDMFAEVPTQPNSQRDGDSSAKAVAVPQAKELDMSMLDDWDDHEGYYRIILGELLDGRYHVQANLGKGMFSGVVRAMDSKTRKLVAIKLIRNNETMRKAGMKEIEILQKLAQADPEDKKHMIRLERHFDHKGHLCMVFENLSINLREVLKKFGRDVGINLKAVRAYAQQMFLGLSLLRKCNVLHADLKPDNVLVNESRSLLKICDLGSASDASDNDITPYLVSRFYRAPEIILGTPYDFAIDIWSVGCTLYELYTGKILFTGRTNNQMLRSIMECRGKFGHKMLRRAHFAGLHFDDLLNFRSVEKDKLTSKDIVRILPLTKPTRDLKARLLATAKGMDDAEVKELQQFADLLDRCLALNPEKRCSPSEALRHPFISRATPAAGQERGVKG
ncbi:MAG: U4/U6 small nuclear ribonucleoprotein prp4 [Thelocarpon impressellum]|nr:MAG: U4/U6 small nuclear ribonucleoprotein prp4 [Thelocarpon impressellum]